MKEFLDGLYTNSSPFKILDRVVTGSERGGEAETAEQERPKVIHDRRGRQDLNNGSDEDEVMDMEDLDCEWGEEWNWFCVRSGTFFVWMQRRWRQWRG